MAGETTLIDELLKEQSSLTAVSRFAQKHEREEIPLQSRYYRDLIPFEKPASDEQYAFEVDLDACSACKACVSACHSLNGLDENETWRDVGVLFGGTLIEPVQQTVTTACHHCADPACANGCPVLAYDKDPETGIVRHLDDQCIGCQYCILKCPYDVPKYSSKRGIVRKCDMCYDRLAVGEAPACVQACPNEAIRITKIKKNISVAPGESLLPGTFDSSYTKPSTIYWSNDPLPSNMEAADARRLIAECGHTPLVVMLVLTQMSIGGLLISWLETVSHQPFSPWLECIASLSGLLGIFASVLHLGQPLKAWRIFLGLRKSWLSREAVLFGMFAPLALLQAFLALKGGWENSSIMEWGISLLRVTTLSIGLASLICSIMVYVDTRRETWKLSIASGKFIGTMLWLGCLAAAAISQNPFLMKGVVFIAILKLSFELHLLSAAWQPGWSVLKRSALTQLHPLRKGLIWRFSLGVLGGIISPILFLTWPLTSFAWIALGCSVAGELLERSLFFRATVAPRMPGTL